MPAFAAFTINDGQASPAAHTFTPVSSENGVYVFQEQVGGIPLGYATVTCHTTRPGPMRDGVKSSADRKTKTKIGIAVSTLETTGTNDAGYMPPPTVACIDRLNIEAIQPERSTLSVRKNVTAFGSNLLAHATFKAVLNDQQGWTGA